MWSNDICADAMNLYYMYELLINVQWLELWRHTPLELERDHSPLNFRILLEIIWETREENLALLLEDQEDAVGLMLVLNTYGVLYWWMNVVLMQYSQRINGYTALNLTKLDILSGLEEVKIAVAYKYQDKILPSVPAGLDVLSQVNVVYETLPG
jgi:hypothetical protein